MLACKNGLAVVTEVNMTSSFLRHQRNLNLPQQSYDRLCSRTRPFLQLWTAQILKEDQVCHFPLNCHLKLCYVIPVPTKFCPGIALHFACLAGSAECVASLITSGADPNLPDKSQTTPLFVVCEAGHHQCVHPVSLTWFK